MKFNINCINEFNCTKFAHYYYIWLYLFNLLFICFIWCDIISFLWISFHCIKLSSPLKIRQHLILFNLFKLLRKGVLNDCGRLNVHYLLSAFVLFIEFLMQPKCGGVVVGYSYLGPPKFQTSLWWTIRLSLLCCQQRFANYIWINISAEIRDYPFLVYVLLCFVVDMDYDYKTFNQVLWYREYLFSYKESASACWWLLGWKKATGGRWRTRKRNRC